MRQDAIRPVYLSPHLDDVALACGGLVHQQAQAGLTPLVITCFAGRPDYSVLSPFATEQHRQWGQLEAPIERRRCENSAAMCLLGAEYEHWDELDCIYRRDSNSGEFFYASEESLFGDIRVEERDLCNRLTTKLSAAFSPDDALLYAPLTAGHHVDHQIVLKAALRLRVAGFRVFFYEDYPYAEDAQTLDNALQPWVEPPVATVRTLDEKDVKAKIAAIRVYRTQLDTLFGGDAAVASRVRSYALEVGSGSEHGERYWQRGTR